MQLFNKSYRGHMIIDGVASYNHEKNKVQIAYDIDYVVYKLSDSFEPITLKFEDDSFEHIKTIIMGQGGESQEITQELIASMNQNEINDPSMVKGYQIAIPSQFNHLNQINISMQIKEYGNDHWQVFSVRTLKPCHQLSVTIRCEDDLIIKNANTYGVEKKFHIKKSDKKIKITYNDWLSPGFGANMVIAKATT